MKATGTKCGINGSHFFAISCRKSSEVQKGGNRFTVITVIYPREQPWMYQNVRFQGNIWIITIIVIHLKGNFCDGE